MKTDLSSLILRISSGGMMLFAHGWGKLLNFSLISTQFPDPIGLGPQVSLAMAVFAEVFCAGFLVLGLFTRLSAIPLIITMLVAVGIVHATDPWDKKEFGLLYLFPYLAILIQGPGRFSLDALIRKKI